MSVSCPTYERDSNRVDSGQRYDSHEWSWKRTQACVSNTHFDDSDREIHFHKVYSTGTALVRGSMALINDFHYYWEIKILTRLYGTDVMIGVGTPDIECNKNVYDFISILGYDSESYGFSYTGKIQHAGKSIQYCKGFNKGDTVGVYLNLWNGTLEFYINGKSMGVAFSNLKRHKVLFPMASSTASHSSIKLIYSMSCPNSLLLLSAKSLPSNLINRVQNIPGFKNIFQRAFWILLPKANDSNHMEYLNGDMDDDPKNAAPHFSSSKRSCCSKMSFNRDHSENKRTETGSDDDQDDLWIEALGSERSDDGMIKFSSKHNRSEKVCQVCNVKAAAVINDTTDVEKCLECFFESESIAT